MMRPFITSTRFRRTVISTDCLCLTINFYVQPSLIHTTLILGWMMIPQCLRNHVRFINELHERRRVKKQKKVNNLIFLNFHQSDYLKPTRLWVICGWLHLTAETKVILQEIFFFSKKVLFHKFDQSPFISVQWNLYKADTIGA